jgi:hypothetical protein
MEEVQKSSDSESCTPSLGPFKFCWLAQSLKWNVVALNKCLAYRWRMFSMNANDPPLEVIWTELLHVHMSCRSLDTNLSTVAVYKAAVSFRCRWTQVCVHTVHVLFHLAGKQCFRSEALTTGTCCLHLQGLTVLPQRQREHVLLKRSETSAIPRGFSAQTIMLNPAHHL